MRRPRRDPSRLRCLFSFRRKQLTKVAEDRGAYMDTKTYATVNDIGNNDNKANPSSLISHDWQCLKERKVPTADGAARRGGAFSPLIRYRARRSRIPIDACLCQSACHRHRSQNRRSDERRCRIGSEVHPLRPSVRPSRRRPSFPFNTDATATNAATPR